MYYCLGIDNVQDIILEKDVKLSDAVSANILTYLPITSLLLIHSRHFAIVKLKQGVHQMNT